MSFDSLDVQIEEQLVRRVIVWIGDDIHVRRVRFVSHTLRVSIVCVIFLARHHDLVGNVDQIGKWESLTSYSVQVRVAQ